ncbi:SRPBCC family protein [Mycobacterium spongiae]|uniref:Cyclase n=1 Tax=Mycobacterium spongiae TaxID=886343 RepID=A0A975PY83_9MYCO|nr:SRPBCC family protein [Mycobacterium spongiae]QUR68877.1 cyclase [Mycobacterium spongiae]
MAVQASGEIVIDAPPEVIMEALADMEQVPTWSSVHKKIEVVDTHPDGRPHHVRVTVKVTGIVDTEMREYNWGPDWMVWDADRTSQQRGQHGEYNLRREAEDKTLVRFSITVEPSAPLPEFWVNRARKKIMHSALEGLRDRVMRDSGPQGPAGKPT